MLLAKLKENENKVSEYLEIADKTDKAVEAHTELGTDFYIEFYWTVGDRVIEAMNGTGFPYKIFRTKFGYSRV